MPSFESGGAASGGYDSSLRVVRNRGLFLLPYGSSWIVV